MKLDDNVLMQATRLAVGSGQFEKTTPEEWVKHFVYLQNRGHMETVVSPQGVLCGFMTWARVEKPVTSPIDTLPEDLDSGEYIQVILACVHPMFEDAGEGLIRDMRDKILDKCIGAKHWSWCRSKDGEDKFVTHQIRRN